MSYDMRFKGTLVFADAASLAKSERQVTQLLDSDDTGFAELWREDAVTVDGMTVSVDVDISAPASWFFSFEAVIETYAEHAASGLVDSWYDGQEDESFGPDVDSRGQREV